MSVSPYSSSVQSGSVGEEVVVEQGLAAGEQVVTEGQLRLAPGVRVQVKEGAA